MGRNGVPGPGGVGAPNSPARGRAGSRAGLTGPGRLPLDCHSGAGDRGRRRAWCLCWRPGVSPHVAVTGGAKRGRPSGPRQLGHQPRGVPAARTGPAVAAVDRCVVRRSPPAIVSGRFHAANPITGLANSNNQPHQRCWPRPVLLPRRSGPQPGHGSSRGASGGWGSGASSKVGGGAVVPYPSRRTARAVRIVTRIRARRISAIAMAESLRPSISCHQWQKCRHALKNCQ